MPPRDYKICFSVKQLGDKFCIKWSFLLFPSSVRWRFRAIDFKMWLKCVLLIAVISVSLCAEIEDSTSPIPATDGTPTVTKDNYEEKTDGAIGTAFFFLGTYRKWDHFQVQRISIFKSSLQGPEDSNSVSSYFIPKHFRSRFASTRAICRSYDMDLAAFETREESDFFIKNVNQLRLSGETRIFVGGMTSIGKNSSAFYWLPTDTPINYQLDWQQYQPDGDYELCLELRRTPDYQFNDISCDDEIRFACEKTVKFDDQ